MQDASINQSIKILTKPHTGKEKPSSELPALPQWAANPTSVTTK